MVMRSFTHYLWPNTFSEPQTKMRIDELDVLQFRHFIKCPIDCAVLLEQRRRYSIARLLKDIPITGKGHYVNNTLHIRHFPTVISSAFKEFSGIKDTALGPNSW